MSYPMRNKAEFLSAARNIEEVLGNVKCGQTFRKWNQVRSPPIWHKSIPYSMSYHARYIDELSHAKNERYL